MIEEELDDEYLASNYQQLDALEFRAGVVLSASLGEANQGVNYILRRSTRGGTWWSRLLGNSPQVHTYRVHPADRGGTRALSDLRDKGIELVANAVAQAADHIEAFLMELRLELAFYVGCLNLAEDLARMDEPISIPRPLAADQPRHAAKGLYDPVLALTLRRKVVSNDIDAGSKSLVIITGANQGGKSTFLRSVGLSQLMMQCGMFVPAESFSANVCVALFSHFKREEDASMESGKLDEELGRMSEIVDDLAPFGMVLLNEFFAATNEREGSEIARQITEALLDRDIKVFFVTHLFELANHFKQRRDRDTLFLRAERGNGGRRTYKLKVGSPLRTSYGADVYKEVFGHEPQIAELSIKNVQGPTE